MEKLSKSNFIFISLMLFSMFFGAGNLIFPPFLGQNSGTSFVPAIIGFLITAVGSPVLGIVVISRFGPLHKLTDHIHPIFSTVFGITLYLSIGPCLAIPRAASMPYEMAIANYLPSGFSAQTGLFIFSVLFFGFCCVLALNPSELIDALGKIMTPILLLLIFAVFVMGFIKPLSGFAPPREVYQSAPFTKGFMEGYLTMDTLGALNFGVLIANSIRSGGVKNEKSITRYSMGVGILSGAILAVIYLMLGWLGAMASSQFPVGANGAVTLTELVHWFFGPVGPVILAAIFLLACLTTCIGLISCCSEYFSSFGKLSYKTWVIIISIWSLVVSNFGLTQILSFSVPVLNFLYPIVIVIILLGLFHELYKNNRIIYPLTVAVTAAVSLIAELDKLHIAIPGVTALMQHLPMYDISMGWVSASLGAAVLALLIPLVLPKSNA